MSLLFDITAHSEEETKKIAKSFASVLMPSDVVVLNGELGAGKTFFVKAICAEFGIDNVSSPSFSIVNEYNGRLKFYHFDFYRIKKTVELYDLGIEDYLSDSESVTFVEWGELYSEVLPKNCYEINISFADVNSRNIIIKKNG